MLVPGHFYCILSLVSLESILRLHSNEFEPTNWVSEHNSYRVVTGWATAVTGNNNIVTVW
jgi:hypothetical protein